jgi:hypothetical protein
MKVPCFTTSLDSAVTLIPPDWTAWSLMSQDAKTRFVADISRMREGGEDRAQSRGDTPALALCAAALEAWAEMADAVESATEKRVVSPP